MKRIIYLAICLLMLASGAEAKSPKLKFDGKGEFKILQFTDIHYIYGKEASEVAIDCINKVIEAEKPDLIVITGDIIFGKPAYEGITTVMKAVSSHGIPFCTTFGNHDDESGLSRSDISCSTCLSP